MTEARNPQGITLEVEGFCDKVRQGRKQGRDVPMAPRLLQDVQAHRSGPATDDTLIVELIRV